VKPKCLCCGEPMEIGCTKNKQKPWASCDECGVQVFIRGRRGVTLFEKNYGGDWKRLPKSDTPAPPVDPEIKAAPKAEPAPATVNPKGGADGNKRNVWEW